MTCSGERLFPRVEFLLCISLKQSFDIVKENSVAITLQNLRRGQSFECRKIQPFVQHRVSREGVEWSAMNTTNGILIRAHLVNRDGMMPEIRNEVCGLFAIEKDMNWHALV